MDRKLKTAIAMTVVAFVFFAAVVTASFYAASNTPLYNYRMEQASNKMHFLPTDMNTFAYNTEKGYNVDFEVTGNPDDGIMYTWQSPWTCVFSTCNYTCQTCDGPTCVTCGYSCGGTCDTCITEPCK
jgi:hypothetical protein